MFEDTQQRTAEAASAPPPPKKLSIYALARETLAKAFGDAIDARAALTTRLRNDEALFDALVVALIDLASYTAVQGEVRHDRARIWNAAANVPTLKSGDLNFVAAVNLMMFPLANGLLLKDATKADLAASIEFYEGQARDMTAKANFLRAVSKETPSGKRVGKALTAERLLQLYQETTNA